MQGSSNTTTRMIHFECRECEVMATCVANPAAVEAWHAHMRTHTEFAKYDRWIWEVEQLPLED